MIRFLKNSVTKFIFSLLLFSTLIFSINLLASGAGILPYTKAPNGKVVVLLGFDAHHSPAGWDDFGGKMDKSDKDVAYAAAREGSEETVRQFGSPNDLYSKTKLMTPIYSAKGDYSCYPIEVGYKNPQTIASARDAASDRHLKEKTAFAWIYLDDLSQALKSSTSNNVTLGTNSAYSIAFSNAYTGNTQALQLYNFFVIVAKIGLNVLNQILASGQTKPVAQQPSITPTQQLLNLVHGQADDEKKAQELIDQGANVNSTEPQYKNTPLHSAASRGFNKIVKVLLQNNAQINTVNSINHTPYQRAIINKHPDTAEIIKNYSLKPSVQPQQPKAPQKPTITTTTSQPIELAKINGTKITLFKGDITKQFQAPQYKMERNAIVNAANKHLQGGGGIDAAVHAAANAGTPGALAKLCSAMYPNGCNTGNAVITPGLALSPVYIIHAVGPQGSDPQAKQLLENTYKNILSLAKQNNIKRVAIPAISTGSFGYNINLATPVAFATIRNYLNANPNAFTEIRIVAFSDSDYNVYKQNATILKSAQIPQPTAPKPQPKPLPKPPITQTAKAMQPQEPPVNFDLVKELKKDGYSQATINRLISSNDQKINSGDRWMLRIMYFNGYNKKTKKSFETNITDKKAYLDLLNKKLWTKPVNYSASYYINKLDNIFAWLDTQEKQQPKVTLPVSKPKGPTATKPAVGQKQ